jgi:hypothetical protein
MVRDAIEGRLTKWEVFDPRYTDCTYYRVPFQWMARLLTRHNGLDYGRVDDQEVLTEEGWVTSPSMGPCLPQRRTVVGR